MKRYQFLGQPELENSGLFEALPVSRPAGAGKFRPVGSSRRGCRKAIHEHDRRLVADRTVRSDLVIVSTPILHFHPGVVKAHEPMRVQALGAELAVEAFDKPVVGRLAWPREVEHDVFLIRPQIEIPANEFTAVVDPNGLRIANAPADPLQRLNDVFSSIAEAGIDHWREACEGIDDRQDTDLAPRRQLVMDKIHRPSLVAVCCRTAVLSQLRLDPPLGDLVPQLQSQLLVKTINPLGIDRPAVTPQKHVNAPVAVADAGLADLLDPMLELGLRAAPRPVDIERSVDAQGRAGTPDRHLPLAAHPVDKLPLHRRPQSFFASTSCSIALSRDRSATSRFSLVFSSSSCRSRFISDGIRPA